ncbi:signal peptidase II [Thermosipho atlanticus]|uniref:signal peptidase II n=1 Tax=Thermosipho atlanticus TaxID=238991 RepID=UPI000933C2AC|nr:signal peptidase II [Thermosipho atlanticus]
MFWLSLAFVIDQITKYFANEFWRYSPTKLLGFFYLTYATNKGIAFGLFANSREIVVYLTLIITLGIAMVPLFKKLSFFSNMFLGFIVGGSLGNIVDRIRFGYVVDFITMPYWPTIYNLADFFILIGAIGLTITILRRRDVGNSSNGKRSGMEIRQVRSGESSGLDLEDIYTESDKERRSQS